MKHLIFYMCILNINYANFNAIDSFSKYKNLTICTNYENKNTIINFTTARALVFKQNKHLVTFITAYWHLL